MEARVIDSRRANRSNAGAFHEGSLMDTADYQHLMQRFAKMVDKPNLRSEFPEQFSKHWENKGRSGVVQIIQASLISEPCDLKFSLFFDGEEVIQTGILIRFQQEPVVNEVRKGDYLDYKNSQRVDPVAFLKEHYATVAADGLSQEFTSESFALATDDDAEPQVMRAVVQLTGKSEEELKATWSHLVSSNPTRVWNEQVSPIIKTWLKKRRDQLDMQFLQDARILHPREQEVSQFTAHDRFYTVITKALSGDAIREKIDSTDPEWWGGAFYAYVNTIFARVPHDPRDRLLFLKNFDSSAEFATEEIFVDNRHIYSVVYTGEEALVWRTRNQVSAETLGIFQPQVETPEPGRVGKLMAKLAGKSAETPAASALELEESSLPAAHPYMVLRAEKAYVEALRARTAELNERRKEYLTLLYDSDPSRFRGVPEDLLVEIDPVIAKKALRKNAAALERERKVLGAHVTLFYDEREGGM